jgi:hypothetical protein
VFHVFMDFFVLFFFFAYFSQFRFAGRSVRKHSKISKYVSLKAIFGYFFIYIWRDISYICTTVDFMLSSRRSYLMHILLVTITSHLVRRHGYCAIKFLLRHWHVTSQTVTDVSVSVKVYHSYKQRAFKSKIEDVLFIFCMTNDW